MFISGTPTRPTPNHILMAEVPQLAEQHAVGEHAEACKTILLGWTSEQRPMHTSRQHIGCIYTETDRASALLFPHKEAEVRYIESLLQDSPHLPQGVILWAPMDQDSEALRHYLTYIRSEMPRICERLCGFRYLLQAITDETAFRRLIKSENFKHNLKEMAMGVKSSLST